MQSEFGYNLPKEMHPEFGRIVKAACDKAGRELKPREIFDLFEKEYLDIRAPYLLKRHKINQESGTNGEAAVCFEGVVACEGRDMEITGHGNGPIDAFFNAIQQIGIQGYQFISYHEHAISKGSDSKAIAYIHLKNPAGEDVFGVGVASNINIASIRGVLCAINRSVSK